MSEAGLDWAVTSAGEIVPSTPGLGLSRESAEYQSRVTKEKNLRERGGKMVCRVSLWADVSVPVYYEVEIGKTKKEDLVNTVVAKMEELDPGIDIDEVGEAYEQVGDVIRHNYDELIGEIDESNIDCRPKRRD